jgi:hypothetical protein
MREWQKPSEAKSYLNKCSKKKIREICKMHGQEVKEINVNFLNSGSAFLVLELDGEENFFILEFLDSTNKAYGCSVSLNPKSRRESEVALGQVVTQVITDIIEFRTYDKKTPFISPVKLIKLVRIEGH